MSDQFHGGPGGYGPPPGQYQQQPPSHYPAQQPYPYPYPYPPQQYPPQQAGGPGNAPRKSRRVVILAIVAVVVLAGAGGGLWLWKGGGLGGSGGTSVDSDTPAAQEWSAAAEKMGTATAAWRMYQGKSPSVAGAEDYWVTDGHLVRRLPGRVVSYDLKTGKEAWEFPLEGTADDDCASSKEQSGQRVALLRFTGEEESDSECGKLTVLNIGTGKEVFTTDLPPVQDEVVRLGDVPTVLGDVVAVPSDGGGHLLDINTGKPLRAPDEETKCREDGYVAFDDLLLARASCGRTPGSDVALNGLRAYDAELNEQWVWKAPTEKYEGGDRDVALTIESVLSLDPFVVELYRPSTDEYLTVRVDDKESEQTTELYKRPRGSTDSDKYTAPCDISPSGLRDCHRSRVADGKLILTTQSLHVNPDTEHAYPGMDNTEYRNELVALDLNTGKEAWRTGMMDGRLLSFVNTDDGKVVAYQAANANDVPGMLVEVDPKTGKLSPLLPIAAELDEDDDLREFVRSAYFGGDGHQAVWAEGTLILFQMAQRTETEGELDMVAFRIKG